MGERQNHADDNIPFRWVTGEKKIMEKLEESGYLPWNIKWKIRCKTLALSYRPWK